MMTKNILKGIYMYTVCETMVMTVILVDVQRCFAVTYSSSLWFAHDAALDNSAETINLLAGSIDNVLFGNHLVISVCEINITHVVVCATIFHFKLPLQSCSF